MTTAFLLEISKQEDTRATSLKKKNNFQCGIMNQVKIYFKNEGKILFRFFQAYKC